MKRNEEVLSVVVIAIFMGGISSLAELEYQYMLQIEQQLHECQRNSFYKMTYPNQKVDECKSFKDLVRVKMDSNISKIPKNYKCQD